MGLLRQLILQPDYRRLGSGFENLRFRVKLGQDRLEQLVKFGEGVCGMPDMLAKMARERGTLFLGKVELHLEKFPWFGWISTPPRCRGSKAGGPARREAPQEPAKGQ